MSYRFFLLAFLLAVPLGPAQAQGHVLHTPPAAAEGAAVNVFFEVDARELDGLRLEAPRGWTLAEARFGTELRPLAIEPSGGTRYVLRAERPARGRQPLTLTFVTGPPERFAEGRLVLRDGASVRFETTVLPAERARLAAFRLADGTPPLRLRRDRLPLIAVRAPLTVEFWIQTTGLGEVVLSTWDGNAEQAYPLEIVIDAHGRLAAFRGRPGYHEALRTPGPVADGAWHHVAFVHDPAAGRSRLLLDGTAVDSLRAPESPMASVLPLTLGGRAASDASVRFGGTLAALRLWPEARSERAVREARSRPHLAVRDGFAPSFEEDLDPNLFARPATGPYRTQAALRLAEPIERFEAEEADGAIRLSWRSRDGAPFVVERSADGERFEAVGRVEPVGAQYRFIETLPGQAVAYYRVRREGTDDTSGTLKLGLADDASDRVLAFLGNAPNPFADATTLLFEVPATEPVTLTVWSVTGTRVATLFEGTLSAGRHEVRFDASALPSGVYFARLQTPSGTAAHRMTLAQ